MAERHEESAELKAVAAAIQDANNLAVQHERRARGVAIWMGGFICFLLLGGALMNLVYTAASLSVVSEFDAAISKMRQLTAPAATSSIPQLNAQARQLDDLAMEVRPRISAIATHSQSSLNQAPVLIAAGAFLALVFALSMSIYRHHLVEVSKLQHSRMAFTRVRVAMHSAAVGTASLLVQQALLDRAFEYRSGKEKQIESPVPGHPVSDSSAAIVQVMADALTKKQT